MCNVEARFCFQIIMKIKNVSLLKQLNKNILLVFQPAEEASGGAKEICDSGISPGSGVGNNRRPLNREVLGVPVIGMGVPTVTDMTADGSAPFMVTPREVDMMISRAARLLAMSIHVALQPAYSPTELMEVARGM